MTNKVVKLNAIRNDVLVTDMHFGEEVTKSGIILRDDNGKTHGIRPRWACVYAVGPKQKEFTPGQWILVSHGRWTRQVSIKLLEGEKQLQRIDPDAILAVSDSAPNPSDIVVNDSY